MGLFYVVPADQAPRGIGAATIMVFVVPELLKIIAVSDLRYITDSAQRYRDATDPYGEYLLR